MTSIKNVVIYLCCYASFTFLGHNWQYKIVWAFNFVSQQEQEKLTDDTNDDSKVQGQGSVKSLNKIIADHKDVSKTVIQLSGIMNTFKSQVQELLSEFSGYSTLWKEVRSFEMILGFHRVFRSPRWRLKNLCYQSRFCRKYTRRSNILLLVIFIIL